MWKHDLVPLVTSPVSALKNDFEAQLVSLSWLARMIVGSQLTQLTRHHSSRYLTAIKQPCAINPSSCAGFAKSEEMRTSCSQSVHNLK